MIRKLLTAMLLCTIATASNASQKADGYHGIWYSNQPSGDEYVYKYSGGLGTYTEKHIPLAIYSKKANKTFFAYGGNNELKPKELMIMIGYYDHKTGMFSRPTIVLEEEGTTDAHRNAVISIDDKGYIWVFAPSHGGKDGNIFKSRKPYSIDDFDHIQKREFSYPQPYYFKGFGHMFLFTKYTGGRELYLSTSPDGINWSEDKKIVGFGGHYMVSGVCGNKRGIAFNWHPPVGGLNARTNLYYMETKDFGKTWTNIQGKELKIPLDTVQNDAMVRNYQAEKLLVYEKGLAYDKQGRPVILYGTSNGYESGPKNGMRTWTLAHWVGNKWEFHKIADVDHNYDSIAFYIEADGTWRIIGPSDPGPQPYTTGGEMVVWISKDQGKTWKKTKQLTSNSKYNHTYAKKPVNAQPDFYAFWADGDTLKPSESRLYYTTKDGKVYMMPNKMTKDFEKPIPVK